MYEDGGPPTLCQPASQQRGGEEVKTWQKEPGGGRRCAGISGGKFFSVAFLQGVLSNFSCAVVWPALPTLPGLSRVDWEGRVERK